MNVQHKAWGVSESSYSPVSKCLALRLPYLLTLLLLEVREHFRETDYGGGFTITRRKLCFWGRFISSYTLNGHLEELLPGLNHKIHSTYGVMD